MASLKRTILINAPVEKVFRYFVEPTNQPELWPSMKQVKDLQQSPNGGTSFRFVYKTFGRHFEGTCEVIEYVANQLWVSRDIEGRVEGRHAMMFQPEADSTRIITEGEYCVHIPLLGRLAAAFVVKRNEREYEEMLSTLKAKMEA